MNQYRIGLLGGIGPTATGNFYNLLIEKLQKSGKIQSNTDFPQIIVNSIPAPELTTLEVTEAMIEPYVKGLQELKSMEPDIIFMVCNTIHLYYDRLKKESGIKNLLSLRECVGKKLKQCSIKKICILGTPLTVRCGLYEYDFLNYINPTEKELKALAKIITDYNSSGNLLYAKEKLKEMMLKKKAEGVDLFLLACTEISTIAHHIFPNSTLTVEPQHRLEKVPNTGTSLILADTLHISAEHILQQFTSQIHPEPSQSVH